MCQEAIEKPSPTPPPDQLSCWVPLLLCLILANFPVAFQPFFSHPPPPLASPSTPNTSTTMDRHHNHRKELQSGPKQPLLCFARLGILATFRPFFWPPATTECHPRPPETSSYVWLPPPSVIQPQISPVAIQRGGKNPSLILQFIEFLVLV